MATSSSGGLWEILANGGEIRHLQELNGHGQPGVSLEKGIREVYDLEFGDVVAYRHLEDENKVEIILPD